ncbi:ribbon-helix-helix protein, CopG family [Candidatus Micrarchaeota archaeon]|nr:ribbon-helix-helix protein, CopG family [Candidatus Micrarchaeota archaeon]
MRPLNNRAKTVVSSSKKSKAEVLSISLSSDELASLSAMQEKLGFSNRSKLLRAGLHALLAEYRLMDELAGRHNVVFVVSHGKEHEDGLAHLLHDFEDSVSTSLHQQSHRRCVEVVMAQGDAKRLRELFNRFKHQKGVQQVHAFIL